MNRFREAREYLGLSILEVSGFLFADMISVQNLEDGKQHDFANSELEALSKLYRRPLPWLLGLTPHHTTPPANLAKLIASHDLSDRDREEIAAFAEFLAQGK